jgi:hypothetical protein
MRKRCLIVRKNDQIWPFFALLVGIQPEFRCFFDGPQADLITGQLPIPLFVALERNRLPFLSMLAGLHAHRITRRQISSLSRQPATDN